MKYICFISILSLLFLQYSCEKDYSAFYQDNQPDIPVTFEGAVTHGFNPYMDVSLADGNIRLTLSIPQSSGRSIAEISRVHAGTTAITSGSARTGTYLAEPIVGEGTQVVFETNLKEFQAYNAQNQQLVQSFIQSQTAPQLTIAFVFLLRLDNGREIIPVQAQVRVNK